jgi:membrane associated rhomboid family serine protease
MQEIQYPITISIIAANVIFSFLAFSNKELLDNTIMWPYNVKRKNELYRFITSGFLHADMIHLFFNMFTLYFFGRNIEIILKAYNLGGSLTYLGLYFGSLIISDLPCFFKYKDSYNYRSLGASGAVSAIVFATIIFSPWESIYLYGAIKISAALYAILFIAYCIYMGKKGNDNINHDAHLWGAIFGLIFILILVSLKQPYLLEGIIEQLKHPSLFGNG